MNPTILGVLGPGFLNQAPTLSLSGIFYHKYLRLIRKYFRPYIFHFGGSLHDGRAGLTAGSRCTRHRHYGASRLQSQARITPCISTATLRVCGS